jgi:hypothetical protein
MPLVICEVGGVEHDKHVVGRGADLNGMGTLQRQADHLDGYWSGRAARAHGRIEAPLDNSICRPNNGPTLELHVANSRAKIYVATALGRIVIRTQFNITAREIGSSSTDDVAVNQLQLEKDIEKKKIFSIRPQVGVSIGRLIANWAGYEEGCARVSAGPGRARVSEDFVPKDWKTHAAAHGHQVGLKIHIERRREGAAYHVGVF